MVHLTHEQGHALERVYYCDPAVFQLDIEKIFRRQWLFAGHVSRIPNRGDFFLYSIAGESLIIVRGADGAVRSFFNTCRHRGALVCTNDSGHVARFVCPYHQWSYDLDGRLLSAWQMPEDFDKSGWPLIGAHCQVVEGLIFVCLSEVAPDFGPVIEDLVPRLAPHQLAQSRICSTRFYTVQANWKLIDENARECYHCPGSHPEYCMNVISAEGVKSAERKQLAERVQRKCEERWRRAGLVVEPPPFRPGTYHSVSRYALRLGAVTGSRDGQPVSTLMGTLPDRDVGVLGVGVYPNFLMEVYSDSAVTLRFTPVSVDRTDVEISWLVSNTAQEGVDFEVDKVEAVWRATAEQDWVLCENNQRGVSSARYRPGPYAPLEWGCEHFVSWYLEQLQ